MNKYQHVILKNVSIKLFNSNLGIEEKIKINENMIELYQNDNYNLNKYNLLINSNVISSVEVYKNEWNMINGYQGNFVCEIDFLDKIEKIKIVFNNNICDPIIFDISYIEANKLIYDELKEKESLNLLAKKASIRVTTGLSLINVLFQPVSEEYSYSKIELYSFLDDTPLLMARYKISDDLFFLAINNLAYGTYKIKVYEYDKDNNIIFESGYHLVTLQRPRLSNINQ